VKRETVLRIVEAFAPPLGQQTAFWLHVTVGVPCVFMFGFCYPLLWRSLRSSASSFLSHLSARTLSGWWSERTSYSRVHSNGGFEETIDAAKAARTRIRKNTALTFEDWPCISRALVIGQAAAMAASQMNRPYGPRYHAAINQWLNANDLARHRRKACRGVAYFRRANRKPKERRAGPTLPETLGRSEKRAGEFARQSGGMSGWHRPGRFSFAS
jgi:hypothetical protein